ncbi:MAG: uroporphyrinogen decarboxylase [Gammaproteobacteria bacterium]
MTNLPLKNNRLIRALLRQSVDKTPIWLMRQAGRYLPEYRALRAQAGSFLKLCKTPELACEATLQPIRRFPLDAAIVFSDILTIPDALGLGLHFVEGEGPRFQKPIRTLHDLRALPYDLQEVQGRLSYVSETIQRVCRELKNQLPVIGFAGSPWTLATYMVEGAPSERFIIIKRLMLEEPTMLHQLLAFLADIVAVYLNAQIAAGAQAVMLFDTWGGILTTPQYQYFSLHYMRNVIRQLTREVQGQRVPSIIFTKQGGQWLEAMAGIGCDAISVDWSVDIGQARQRVGKHVALQGNLDPAVLYAKSAVIRQEVQAILASYGHGTGHVFNLGHGIYPDVPPENVAALVEAVHEYSIAYHVTNGAVLS